GRRDDAREGDGHGGARRRSRRCATNARATRRGVPHRRNARGDFGMTTADLLGTIVAATTRIVEVRTARESHSELERRALAVAPRPGVFTAALATTGRFNVIAECKRRSP